MRSGRRGRQSTQAPANNPKQHGHATGDHEEGHLRRARAEHEQRESGTAVRVTTEASSEIGMAGPELQEVEIGG